MLVLKEKFKGAVNVYTLDHRGTGRSFYLNCRAAQAFTPGSLSSCLLDVFEGPNCIKDVLFQIDNKTEAFSTTSAAKDIEYVVKNLNTEGEIYVYGGSYGSFLTARLMHLAPTTIKGYILDGVVSERNGSFARISSNRVSASKLFAALCEKDSVCVSKYGYGIKEHGDLHSAWLATLDALDKAKPGSNVCADMIRGNSTTQSASSIMRVMFSTAPQFPFGFDVSIAESQRAIPKLLQMLNRCKPEDVKTLRIIFQLQDNESIRESIDRLTKPYMVPPAFDEITSESYLLMYLIKVSEMWLYPPPSWEDEVKLSSKGVFTLDITADYALYCLINGDWNDPACPALTTYGKQKTPPQDYSKIPLIPFKYERNQYYGKVAKVPNNASLLFMQGHLDFQTVFDLAKDQYDKMEGTNKVFVEFPYAGHCPTMYGDDCGASVLASFVSAGGSVTAVNTSCIRSLPAINFDVDATFAKRVAEYEGASNGNRTVPHQARSDASIPRAFSSISVMVLSALVVAMIRPF
ncbi:hypothetical protein PINS_up011588 [Pythium insidiosum]|nr:hypothetical protein PINS_up011588 [Pythium insidiosum]